MEKIDWWDIFLVKVESSGRSVVMTIQHVTRKWAVTMALGLMATAQAVQAVELSDAEKAEGWKVLFNGKDFTGWRSYKNDGVKAGWQVVDGAMVHTKGGGDLITEEQYEDYELSLEWKLAEKGNSGIFLAAKETAGPIYFTGIEMQILDDEKHPDGVHVKHRSGGCYGLYQPPAGAVKKIGEWNKVHIVKQGDHYRFYLNGIKTADFRTEGNDFKNRVANSKFGKWKYFGRHNKGHIGFQDHGDKVSFKNVKLRELSPVQLFNGKNIENWEQVAQTKEGADKTWKVNNGILQCSGLPVGYLMTKDSHRDYQLDIEWRWPRGQKPGNSGLLLHVEAGTKAAGIWPKCLESQLMHSNAGDFWMLGSTIQVPDMATRAQAKGRNIPNLIDDVERPLGEWNHMRTICRGGEVTVYVNGELANYGFQSAAQHGRIAFQSEKSAIEFRKIELTPLPGK